METAERKQKIGFTQTGSFFNLMIGNNRTLPVVGEGATILLWTDRHAYEVTWVSEDFMECTIQRYAPERVDKYGMSDSQDYKYEKLTDRILHLVYRQGAWRSRRTKIEFTREWKLKAEEAGCFSITKLLTEEQKLEIFEGECWPQKVVPGFTREKKVYHKVHVLFGEKREYYDFSF